MGNPNPVRTTPFAVGNQAGAKHGGAAACVALTKGTPLSGLAGVIEDQVAREIELDGLHEMRRVRLIRKQAVADLYYGLYLGALEDGDVVKADGYVRRYGWLDGAAHREAMQLADVETEQNADVLDAAIADAGEVLDGTD